MLPTPNIDLSKIPECQKYLDKGSHRRLYTWSPNDYKEMSGIWGNGEQALPGDPPGELEVIDGLRIDGQKGFEVLPKRWVVERTFSWMTRWRRLVRDYEKRIDVSTAMIHVAMGSLLWRRIVH